METTAAQLPLQERFYPARITDVSASVEGGARRIRVLFDDGACRLFDLSPHLDRPALRRLQDEAYFARVAPDGPYAVAWPEGEDLSCGTIYHGGEPCSEVGGA